MAIVGIAEIADPKLQIAVVHHIAEEGLVQNDVLVEFEQHVIVLAAGVVDRVGVFRPFSNLSVTPRPPP